MRSTMQDGPLLISGILRHGQDVYGESQVITVEADGYRAATFAEVAARAERLAKALAAPGRGRRATGSAPSAGTTRSHLEAYLAVPSMGAVLHTLNIRLFPEQLAYVINHAEDKVIIVDALADPAARQGLRRAEDGRDGHRRRRRRHRRRFGDALSYEELLAAEEPGFDWPELDERDAAAMCYTSGTTGNPKGVVYSPPLDVPALAWPHARPPRSA